MLLSWCTLLLRTRLKDSFICTSALAMTIHTSDTMPCDFCLYGYTVALLTDRPSLEMLSGIPSFWCQKLQYLF